MNRSHQATSVVLLALILSLTYFLRASRKAPQQCLPPNEDEKEIPSIVHFIVGQTDEKIVRKRFQLPSSFSFVNYLVLLAARRHLRPGTLLVHYYEEPNTFWWNRTKQDAEINMTLVQTRLVQQIFYQPIYHHTHRSDILRLEILLEYGGIYLDIDVLTLRSFQPLLTLGNVVMGFEDGSHRLIGSAVILAKKNAQFLKRIYDAYQNYDSSCYRCNSIETLAKLAAIYPKEVALLPANSFFVPSWSQGKTFFESDDYDFIANYASHLWNSFNGRRLSTLSPKVIMKGNFTLARMFRQALGGDTIDKLQVFFH